MIGLREPAAKGAIVSGTKAADIILYHTNQPLTRAHLLLSSMPFKGPVVASMGGRRIRHWRRLVRCKVSDSSFQNLEYDKTAYRCRQ